MAESRDEDITADLVTADLRRMLDENAILGLMARFDDAILRRDKAAMQALWAPEGVWEIGQFNPDGSKHITPLRAQGMDQILAAQQQFNDLNEFFFRTTLRAVITLDGDRAAATAPSTEFARRKDGHGYSNVALYEDALERRGGSWVFASRKYFYLWVDSVSPILGGDALPLPPSLRGPA